MVGKSLEETSSIPCGVEDLGRHREVCLGVSGMNGGEENARSSLFQPLLEMYSLYTPRTLRDLVVR